MDTYSFEGMNSVLAHPPSIGVPQGFAPLTLHPAVAPPRAATTQESHTLIHDHRTYHLSLDTFMSVLCVGIEHFPRSY